jgi:chromosomal replication initiator protein
MSTLFSSDNTADFLNSETGLESFQDAPRSQSEYYAWTLIKEKIRTLIDPDRFETWIAPLQAHTLFDNELIIVVPDMVHYQTIITNYYLELLERCKNELGLSLLFRFEINEPNNLLPLPEESPNDNLASSSDTGEFLPLSADPPPSVEEGATGPAVSRALNYQLHLHREYTFFNFVNGSSNQFAHASCLAVADDPGQNYNPLFIYGSTGLGKTHLLHAVGNHVLKTRPELVVTYVSSEQFINEMIYCIRFNKMWDFRRKYRSCDVLLVDDIQFISKKERTQEEFFHTFNALYEAKKQIVVTSDVFPQDIPDIEDRLRNRFQWGLIADIQPPDVEHRIAILLKKAEQQCLPLTPDVAEYIAHQVKGSVRLLEGALKRVAAFATLHGSVPTLQLAAEAFQNVIATPTKKVTIEHILKVVADYYKIKVADLKSKKRQRNFSLPRQVAMYLSRVRTEASFPDIGEKFGGKDHTTVMYAVKKIEQDKNQDLELKTHIEALERKLDQ